MTKIRIGKLEAARRRTAIRLWFAEDDLISAHTLAFAAYEVLHYLSQKRDPYRRDLLFDTDWVKDEYRKNWLQLVKKEANFFKHADRDGDSVIEFDPRITEYFILFAMAARESCGEAISEEELVFNWWARIHRVELLSDKGLKLLEKQLPINDLNHIKAAPKREFFERVLRGIRAARR